MKPVRIAVIGAGTPNVATSNHLPAIAASDELELACLCDLNESGVRRYAEEYGCDGATNYAEVLSRDDIEAVDICTPDWLHAEQTIAAARAGKHILCEKPVALSMAEAHAMAKAVRNANVVFLAGHVRRFSPLARKLREVLDAGGLGRVVYVRIAVQGAFFPYPKGSPYYTKATGGQFLHNGPHYADLLCQIVPARPLRIHGLTRRFYPNPDEAMETDNFTAATVRFEDGAIGAVEQNLLMIHPRGYPARETIQIIGTKASLTWNSHENATMFSYLDGAASFSDPSAVGAADPFVGEVTHFARCVRGCETSVVDIDVAMRSLSICLGALHSAETGQPVKPAEIP
jgi:predicted dehydrogenase